jgi:hypothetical protein
MNSPETEVAAERARTARIREDFITRQKRWIRNEKEEQQR